MEAEEEAAREARRIVASIQQRSREERREQEIEVAGGVYWMVPVRVSESNFEPINVAANLNSGWK